MHYAQNVDDLIDRWESD